MHLEDEWSPSESSAVHIPTVVLPSVENNCVTMWQTTRVGARNDFPLKEFWSLLRAWLEWREISPRDQMRSISEYVSQGIRGAGFRRGNNTWDITSLSSWRFFNAGVRVMLPSCLVSSSYLIALEISCYSLWNPKVHYRANKFKLLNAAHIRVLLHFTPWQPLCLRTVLILCQHVPLSMPCVLFLLVFGPKFLYIFISSRLLQFFPIWLRNSISVRNKE
jgi:hypothetical protein